MNRRRTPSLKKNLNHVLQNDQLPKKTAAKKKQKKELPDSEHTSLGICKGNDDEDDDALPPATGSKRTGKKEKNEKKETKTRKKSDRKGHGKKPKGKKHDACSVSSTTNDQDDPPRDQDGGEGNVSQNMLDEALKRASDAETKAVMDTFFEAGVSVGRHSPHCVSFCGMLDCLLIDINSLVCHMTHGRGTSTS